VAHTSAITQRVETHGWSLIHRDQMYRGQRWIAAWDDVRPEMDDTRWIPSHDGYWLEMDRNLIWMDNRRCMKADGWKEMYLGRWITGDGWQSICFLSMKTVRLCEVITLPRSLTVMSSYEVQIERGFEAILCSTAKAAPSTMPCTNYYTIQNTLRWYRLIFLHAQGSMPNTIHNPKSSNTYNADTS
jgi:hypothetical protein